MTSRHRIPALSVLVEPDEIDVEFVGFPLAGGSPSAYRALSTVLPRTWRLAGVLQPGRGSRFGEEFHRDLGQAAAEIAEELAGQDSAQRLILFGHSAGALLALEVARRVTPDLLVVAGCRPPAPGVPIPWQDPDPMELRELTREGLVAAGLRDRELLDELVEIDTPILAADIHQLRGYTGPATPVSCDIVSYYGADDDVPMRTWSACTAGSATTVIVPGDHYFVQHSAGPLAEDLIKRVEARHDGL